MWSFEHPYLFALVLWLLATVIFTSFWVGAKLWIKRIPRGACWCGRAAIEDCVACGEELCQFHLWKNQCVRCQAYERG